MLMCLHAISVQAIEALVEQMAAGAALIETPASVSSPTRAAAEECSAFDTAAAAQPAVQPVGAPDKREDSSKAADGNTQQRDHDGVKQKKQRGREEKHPPRNKPCPCGSKAKYKNCCGSAARLQKKAAASSVDAGALAMPQQLLV
jgi:SEC-C motif